eukprot:2315441-Alexandrium_andersonii.AAC.1
MSAVRGGSALVLARRTAAALEEKRMLGTAGQPWTSHSRAVQGQENARQGEKSAWRGGKSAWRGGKSTWQGGKG